MSQVDDTESAEIVADEQVDETPSFSSWLKQTMDRKHIKIPQLVASTGITYAGIWNIAQGKTKAPREETRKKLAAALGEDVPEEIESASEKSAMLFPGFEWGDFTPHDLATVPDIPGVYVFYDVTDRPVYVGKSNKSIRTRVHDHQTRFWFKRPLVERGAFLEIKEKQLCDKIETILIKFLGKNALLNVKSIYREG